MKGIVSHIELYVQNLDVSKAFWGWLLKGLGYKEYQSWQMGVSYKLGETYIVLVQVEERYKDIPYHRCGAGLNHLAFNGESRAFVDEMTTKLREKGVTVLYEDRHPARSHGIPGYFRQPIVKQICSLESQVALIVRHLRAVTSDRNPRCFKIECHHIIQTDTTHEGHEFMIPVRPFTRNLKKQINFSR